MAQDYNYSPAINRNLEMLFDNYLSSYNKIINIDPTTMPVDTFGTVEVLRDAQGQYINGREIWLDTVRTNWLCSMQNGVNVVDMVDVQNGSAILQKDRIHTDASGRDTLIEIYVDTIGNGTLVKSQDFYLFYDNFGIDSAALISTGGGFGSEVLYMMRRDAVGRPDSLVIAISFVGVPYPVQTLIYYENSNGGLDSINLYNNFTGEVEEQVRATNDASNKVIEFTFYEKDMNDEWDAYDTYILSQETFFSLMEGPQAFEFSLYPNPAQDFIQVDLNQNCDFRIFHLSGAVMKAASLSQGEAINIEDLPEGVYFLQLELADGSTAGQRFVKK